MNFCTPVYPGPPGAGSGPDEIVLTGPPSKGGTAENLHTKLQNLRSVARWLGLGLKWLICISTVNDITETDRNVCDMVGPRASVFCTGLSLFSSTLCISTWDIWWYQKLNDYLVM